MERYLFVTNTDCADPSREDEFNDWYNNVHVPDMLETPGMISATRWENVFPKNNKRRKYTALYEFETDNIEKFDAALRETGRGTKERGRLSDLIVLDPPDVPRIIYRQVMPTRKAKKTKK
jgi:hypothetical protein